MKTLIFSFLILNISIINAQENTLIVKPDFSNLAIFISDFVSNNFERRLIYHLPKNNTRDLLFQIDYQSPSDFGSIEFKHQLSNTIVFSGTINWDGAGKITIPETFLQSSKFTTCKNRAKQPKLYEYYANSELDKFMLSPKTYADELSNLWGIKKTHIKNYNNLEVVLKHVWKSINNLKIVNDLLQ